MKVPVAILLSMVAAACGSGSEPPVVLAASSLTDVAPELLEASGEGDGLELHLGGSSTLAVQILDGAPAGVFVSADPTTMQMVVHAGLATRPIEIARNRLVLVRSPGSRVEGLSDLARDELLVGLCAVGVPCGELAWRELDARGIDPLPDTEEPDVRSLMAKVIRGELDAALVYRTDALAAGSAVEVVETDLAAQTSYLAALVGDRPPDAATRFLEFLQTPTAREILVTAGFEVP